MNTKLIQKFVRVGLIPAGYLMEFTGIIFKEPRIEYLGHYISCSGKNKTLPGKDMEKYILIDDDYITYIEEDKISYLFPGESKFYEVVGKCIIHRISDTQIEILDRYEFYPWCGNQDHFNNCGCKQSRKLWGRIPIQRFDILFKLIKFIYCDLLHKVYFERSNKLYTLYISRSAVMFDISDYLFSLIGKPFNSRTILNMKKEFLDKIFEIPSLEEEVWFEEEYSNL